MRQFAQKTLTLKSSEENKKQGGWHENVVIDSFLATFSSKLTNQIFARSQLIFSVSSILTQLRIFPMKKG
jgi:hypothetical protein